MSSTRTSRSTRALTRLIQDLIDSNSDLQSILKGEKIQYIGYMTQAVSSDERKFYSRDEVFEAIQRRFSMRADFIAVTANVKGTIIVDKYVILGRYIYNHPKDFRFEQMVVALTSPAMAAFAYGDENPIKHQ
jgi:hypothetical protein